MHITKALKVTVGTVVRCPPDRGDPGYTGKVTHIDKTVCKNHAGDQFMWFTVQHPRGTKHVWPSNRLS